MKPEQKAVRINVYVNAFFLKGDQLYEKTEEEKTAGCNDGDDACFGCDVIRLFCRRECESIS
ncbi:hypothetical protein TCA2_0094 [Paenibacillus sp. TCA20]|nr:hypothetical protein TCA2_0094 [Paenibacillus sp. TCA20]